VADPGAAIDIVGPDNGPHEFLHEIVFFIGTAGGRNTGNGIRTMFGSDLIQILFDDGIGFIPGGFYMNTILFYQGRCESFRVVVEFKGIASFHTTVAGIHLRFFSRFNTDDGVVLYRNHHIAAHATVGACGSHNLIGPGGFCVVTIIQGIGWTVLHTGTAGNAFGITEALVGTFDDPAVKPSPFY